MSDYLYEVVLTSVDNQVDLSELAKQLSPVIDMDEQSIELQLVDTAMFSNPQTIKGGLPKAKAEKLRAYLNSLGIESRLGQEISLQPIEQEQAKDKMEKCPACGHEQVVELNESMVCDNCGVVKEKFDARIKREKIIKHEREKQLSLENYRAQELRKKYELDDEEKIRESVRKEFRGRRRLVSMPVILASVMVAFLGGSILFYQYSVSSSQKPSVPKPMANKGVGGDKNNADVSANTEQAVQTEKQQENRVQASDVAAKKIPVSNEEVDAEVLSNPYAKAVGVKPQIKMTPAAAAQLIQKHVGNIDNLTRKDTKTTTEIVELYEQTPQIANNKEEITSTETLQRIAEKADAISDDKLKNKILSQVVTQAVEQSLIPKDKLGIKPTTRNYTEEEDVSRDMIGFLMKGSHYDLAVHEAKQVKSSYSKALLISQVAEKGLKAKPELLEQIMPFFNEKKPELSHRNQALVLGMESKVHTLADNENDARMALLKALKQVNQISGIDQQMAVLEQLKQDQLDYSNLSSAKYVMEYAKHLIEKSDLPDDRSESYYAQLAQGFVQVMDLDKASEIANQLIDIDKKRAIDQSIQQMESLFDSTILKGLMGQRDQV